MAHISNLSAKTKNTGRTAEPPICSINKVYFGNRVEDPDIAITRDYLKDDLLSATLSLLHYYILDRAMRDGYNIVQRDLKYMHTLALITSIRKVVKPERKENKNNHTMDSAGSRTGGDFVKDLTSLKLIDLEHFKNITPSVPEGIKNHNLNHSNKLFYSVRKLAKRYQSKNYYYKIVKDNEEILLHKDRCAEKRKIILRKSTQFKSPFFHNRNFISTTILYKHNANIDIGTIQQGLNEMSNIIAKYELLMYTFGIEFVCPPRYSILKYAEQILDIYSPDLRQNQIVKEIKEFLEKLKPTIEVCGWTTP